MSHPLCRRCGNRFFADDPVDTLCEPCLDTNTYEDGYEKGYAAGFEDGLKSAATMQHLTGE